MSSNTMSSDAMSTDTAPRAKKLYEQYRNPDKTRIDPDILKRVNRSFTWWGRLLVLLASVLYIMAIWHFTARSSAWYLLGGIMFVYMLIKKACALLYRPSKAELTKDYKVSVILTCYNEDPQAVVSILDNILELDYPVHEIIFLDDGSADPTACQVAQSYADDHKDRPGAPIYQILCFEKNRGKRAVMTDGFKAATGDYVFMLDSDIEILPNALTELLRPFEDGKTTSVVGNISVLNRQNFLTKMQAMTYFNAFQQGRSAQSIFGDVIVCSGAFTLHQKAFIMAHLQEFKESKALGVTVSSGDDRQLTSFSRMSGGKTRYQNTAYGETMVPATWRKFQAQRRRWQRSAYICSLTTIRDLFPRKPLFMLWSFAEAYFWLIALILTIVTAIATGGFYFDWRDFLIFTSIALLMHNGFYLLYRPLHFFLVPLYTLVYGISLAFTRVHAFVTLGNDGWGTRNVEEDEAEKEDA
ncbi:MAG: glycosyltransferase family 2 protein, partial [Defluviitaleaceae bacterium]|nr:glycosyltransferase family 2 protein [Defluviitaleaceae bacterium]